MDMMCCTRCGKEVTRASNRKYCSECSALVKKERDSNKNQRMASERKVSLKCVNCGRELAETRTKSRKYCSKECYSTYTKKEGVRDKSMMHTKYVVMKDPDDAWVENSSLEYYDFKFCLEMAVFTQGTIIRCPTGETMRVIGQPSSIPGTRANAKQRLERYEYELS